jgi:diaminohydroxyphosphoribosylaminopyrimidine deaminase/5-amino-6-(5-phosphoribosylamino)uracil reductase
VNAIAAVDDERLLRESTMYVNLEPCAHYGKTPPCADLIIKKGIPRIVVGCRDSFDQVDGKGIEKLRNAGIEVLVGILEEKCIALNRAFFTYHAKQRPYITLKWAQSMDGYIDLSREENGDYLPVKFSNKGTVQRVHRLRALNDAILVGRRTAALDNPSLTTRLWPGKCPLRLVVDRWGVLDKGLHLFDKTTKTVVFTEVFRESIISENVEQVALDFSRGILQQMMEYLYVHKVQRLLVEGGAVLLQDFINSGLWDEAFVEEVTFSLGDGVKAPTIENETWKEKIESFGHQLWHFLH